MNKIENESELESKPRVRRVGTLTMGSALVVVGLITIYGLFTNKVDFVVVAKLAPLILVFLGLEMLISHFRFKGVRLKYDFLSSFVCFLLIFTSIGAATVPTFMEYYGPQRYEQEFRLAEEMERYFYEKLKGNQEIKSLNVTLDLYERFGHQKYDENRTIENLKDDAYIGLRFDFIKEFKDANEFVISCKTVIDQIANDPVQVKEINFSNGDSNQDEVGNTYSLEINDNFQMNMTVEQLKTMVESTNHFE